MNIVVVANFSGVDSRGNNRFIYIANKLYEMGNSVVLITNDFNHFRKERRDTTVFSYPFDVIMLHEPGYKKNISLKRFWSHFVWGRNVRKYLAKRKKPDAIYCAVPSLSGPLAAAKYCEKNGVKFIIDVQDLWPEAFQMVFHVPVISNFIFAPFKAMANGIYRRADEICAVSDTYVDRALSVNKKCAVGHSVFLGTRLEDFDRYVEENPVKDKPTDEVRLGYCGTLGASYDLTCVFDALRIVEENGAIPPKFIIMGDGPRREEFETYAKKRDLNVEFTGRLPYPQMCGKLAACDIVVNPIKVGSAGSIINKHADYAASGLPVLNTQECEEYRHLVDEYHMGFNCSNGDAADLADKLFVLLNDAELRKEMGANARRCAEEKFDRENSYVEICKLLLKETKK